MILEVTNTTKEIGIYENSSIFEKNDGFDGHVEMCYIKCYSAISGLSLKPVHDENCLGIKSAHPCICPKAGNALT